MEWVAQIVTQNGNELIAQHRGLSLVRQTCLTGDQSLICVDVESDKLGEQFEHPDRFRRPQLGRPRVDCAESAEKRAVSARYRHRDIALAAVHGRRRIETIDL